MPQTDIFTNAPQDIADIPAAAELDFRPISRRYIWVSVIYTLIFVLPLTATASGIHIWGNDTASAVVTPPYIGLGTALLLGLGVTWSLLAIPRMGYAVRERDVFYRAGVLWRKVTALPLVRVQHVETSHGPLERLFGLATLKIFTAGAMTADVTIFGLPQDEAERLHQFLLNWTDETGETGATDD